MAYIYSCTAVYPVRTAGGSSDAGNGAAALLQQTMQPRFDLFLVETEGDDPALWRSDHLCDAFQL